MGRSFYYSLALHIILLLLLVLGMPAMRSEMMHDYAIVAEVVPISELSNVNTQKMQKRQTEKTMTSKAKAPPVSSTPTSNIRKEQDASSTRENQPKNSTINKNKDAEKVPTTSVSEKKQPNKKPKDKEKTNKQDIQPKDKAQDFASSILKSLESKNSQESKEEEPKVDFKNIEKLLQGDSNKPFNENLPMSISEVDAIKSQIVSKWNTASFNGAAAEGMQVIVLIELDMQGNVVKVQPQIQSHSSPYYRAFVESAVRAAHLASPLQNLSSEKYHNWKEIEFRFDSSGMIH
jgi:outer membrane biosynthesis protein TonB